MRLAVSSIAWTADQDAVVAPLLADAGVGGIELAPTRVWPDLAAARDAAVRDHRRFWEDHGLAVPAMQALLYGRDDLLLFGSDAGRQAMLTCLGHAVRIGALLGARVLVFGSPRNRLRGPLGAGQALAIAVPFFRTLGALADQHGVAIGIEANPTEYGCDFLTNHAELRQFVAEVDHPGIVHHVDLGGAILAGEDPAAVVTDASPLRHFHASTPHLAPPLPGSGPLIRALGALSRSGYQGWVSLEMRRQAGDPVGAVLQAVRAVGEAHPAP